MVAQAWLTALRVDVDALVNSWVAPLSDSISGVVFFSVDVAGARLLAARQRENS